MTDAASERRKAAATRRAFVITGQVQGVGFRPAVFRMAEQWGLSGFVRNTAHGVELEAQGAWDAIEGFTARFHEQLAEFAPMARVEKFSFSEAAPRFDECGFAIIKSETGPERDALISPDMAPCPECVADILDASGRRYHYPFANCTNCGPRYTIIRDIPYDRAATTMACFPMCAECAEEFENPLNRRFHAQPNACSACGPHIWLTDDAGRLLAEGEPGLDALAAMLLQGKIAAIKGLGGFHLACDACDEKAVALLRKRKSRPAKPFAVMARDSREAALLALFGKEEQALLESPAAPIVLCRKRNDAPVCSLIAPDTDRIGLMLPSTPLHHLLFDRLASLAPGRPLALIMTSGNKSGLPIALGNREALRDLAGLADCFLLHDRDILIRVDDSVVRRLPGGAGTELFRRARGYVPRPIAFGGPSPDVSVMAFGAELKNTICLTRKRDAFISQHIGDLSSFAAYAFLCEMTAHFPKILAIRPDAVVCDLHPDYPSAILAHELAAKYDIPLFSMQHHAAHAYSVLAEHKRMEKTLGLALDGAGLGHDHTIWGGELLLVDPECPQPDCVRLGHIASMPLPGGDAAAREPWRMTLALLHAIGEPMDAVLASWGQKAPSASDAALLTAMLNKDALCPRATSCGRLFDAVFGLLAGEAGALAQEYEGQAAIRLETLMSNAMRSHAVREWNRPPGLLQDAEGRHVLDTLALFRQAFMDWKQGTAPELISLRFHAGLTEGLARLAMAGAEDTGVKTVALSGGVLQNSYIRTALPRRLCELGLSPLLPLEAPANDGGLSLGQAFWGVRILASTRGSR